jgi:hypothetical protein
MNEHVDTTGFTLAMVARRQEEESKTPHQNKRTGDSLIGLQLAMRCGMGWRY